MSFVLQALERVSLHEWQPQPNDNTHMHAGALGGFVGPIIVGNLSRGGDYSVSMYVLGALSMISGLMFLGEPLHGIAPCCISCHPSSHNPFCAQGFRLQTVTNESEVLQTCGQPTAMCPRVLEGISEIAGPMACPIDVRMLIIDTLRIMSLNS